MTEKPGEEIEKNLMNRETGRPGDKRLKKKPPPANVRRRWRSGLCLDGFFAGKLDS